MNSIVLFLNAFLSYLLVFVIFAAVVIVALICGIKLRGAKNAKAGISEVEETPQTDSDTQ